MINYKKKLKKENWINPKIKVRKSSVQGKGMFAIDLIKKGEVLIVWGGDWGIHYTDSKKKAEKAKLNKCKLVIQWDDNLFSIESRGRNRDWGYCINHSCNPNSWVRDAFTLVARRNIKAGQEITVDYVLLGDVLQECKCGSLLCRGKITSKDWKLPELQRRYKNHFTPYLKKKILKALE